MYVRVTFFRIINLNKTYFELNDVQVSSISSKDWNFYLSYFNYFEIIVLFNLTHSLPNTLNYNLNLLINFPVISTGFRRRA